MRMTLHSQWYRIFDRQHFFLTSSARYVGYHCVHPNSLSHHFSDYPLIPRMYSDVEMLSQLVPAHGNEMNDQLQYYKIQSPLEE